MDLKLRAATVKDADSLACARGRGYAWMRLFTPAAQARARRFYEREGWCRRARSSTRPARTW